MSEKRCGEIIKQTRRRGELKSHAKFRSPVRQPTNAATGVIAAAVTSRLE
ncbi:MAG: hypothetical protein F6K58_09965 [Symploca sp. SIO2E9]|nr:hypothetical protein [Symploca sp. SIO2E9]